MKKTLWFKNIGLFSVFIVFLALCDALFAQNTPKLQAGNTPCNDSLYLRLKDAPPVSLTESERAYIKQKRKECEEYRYGKVESSGDTPENTQLSESLSKLKEEEEKPDVAQEEILTARNIGIFSVVMGALTGLIIALGSVTEAPF